METEESRCRESQFVTHHSPVENGVGLPAEAWVNIACPRG
jgi:hypothetical protein